ncbi:jg11928 [Pararge aegeria aegeria]|uniref:Jg11928 protein n=1 Tax=Pararge aegeria aegeria TaxID=348720 RepID=A0A8S4S6T0_9NEOP|nr:jg11928 [Pararge aegeria aegeria]
MEFHRLMPASIQYPTLVAGRPAPTVIWLIDGTPAPQYVGEKTDTHVVVNKLDITHVKRSHLNTTFKCRASNTKLVSPQEKSVRLEMNLKPTLVLIQSKPATLSSERYVSLSCVAEGSRPPAQLTWFKDNRKFKRGKVCIIFISIYLTPSDT